MCIRDRIRRSCISNSSDRPSSSPDRISTFRATVFCAGKIGFTPTDRHAEIVFQLLVAEILEYERLFYVTEVEVLGPVFPYFAIEFLVLLVP